MVFFNYATMQMAAKIVYYGPGLCGKTTNLQFIYQKTSPKSRGEMVSLETETDRTLFFDLLPLDVGNIAGFKTRFQLYTVPGQVFYNSTRKLVLRGVDGIVFVADSQLPMMDANVESLNNLRANLSELGLNLDEIPLVLQYNKRDLKNTATVENLNRILNPKNLPHFEASAVQGTGVFETLKGISKTTLIALRKRALGEEKLKIPEVATRPGTERPRTATPPPPRPSSMPPAPAQAQSHPLGQQSQPSPAPPPVAPPAPSMAATMAAVVQALLPTAAELAKEKVEFAEVAVPEIKPSVKKIAVKTSDIAAKLDSLRDLYTGKNDAKPKKAEKFDALSMILGAAEKDREKKVTKKLKIRLDPDELERVKNLAMDLHLTGDSVEKHFSNMLTVGIEGKSNPKRVVLQLEIEIVKKQDS